MVEADISCLYDMFHVLYKRNLRVDEMLRRRGDNTPKHKPKSSNIGYGFPRLRVGAGETSEMERIAQTVKGFSV